MSDKEKAMRLFSAYCKDEPDDVSEMASLLNHIENEAYNDGFSDAKGEAQEIARRCRESIVELEP